MKTRLTVVTIAVLVASVALGAVVFAQEDEPAVVVQEELAPAEPASPDTPVYATRPWSMMGSTCVPDDDTGPTRYDSNPTYGYVEFAPNITGYLYFTCMVNTPIDAYQTAGGLEPDWNRLYLFYRDPDSAGGFVEATLLRKYLGAPYPVSTVTTVSSNANPGAGLRMTGVIPPVTWDFDLYAYFVRVRLYRTSVNSDQEFHMVRLQSRH